MLYAYSMTVEQPAEMYDKVNAELEEELHRPLPQGCLVHLATRTATGFRVTEVWESHEACDRFADEVMRPLIGRVMGQQMLEQGPPPSEDWDVMRLEVDAAAFAHAT